MSTKSKQTTDSVATGQVATVTSKSSGLSPRMNSLQPSQKSWEAREKSTKNDKR